MTDSEFGGLEPLAGLRIEDDAPGSRLHLVWTGTPPYFMVRLAVFALVAGLLGWSAWSAYELAADPQRFFNQDLDEGIFRILGIVLRLGIAWFAAQLVAWGAGYWRELDFNAGENTFVGRRTGFLVLDNQRVSMPLDKITYAMLTAHRTLGSPELGLRLAQLEGETFEGRFPTVGLDPRGPEQDLLYRIGRMLGSEGVFVEEHSPVRTRLRLDLGKRLTALGVNEDDLDDDDDFDDDLDHLDDDEEAEDAKDAEAEAARQDDEDGEDDDADDDSDDDWTPPEMQLHPLSALASFSVTALAEQASLEASSFADDEAEDAAPFDVEAFNAQFELWKIADWRPGQVIKFERKAEARWLINTLTVLAFLAGGGLGAWLAHDWVSWVPFNPIGRWGTGLYCGVAAAIVARVFAFHRMCTRDLTIDWLRREYIVEMHGRPRVVPFKSGRRLALWTTEATAGPRAEPASETRQNVREYKALLTLVADGGDLLLYDGEKLHTSRERARTLMEPFARQMSRVLNLPCQQAQNFAVLDEGYPAWTALTPGSWSVLASVAVVTVALLGYAYTLAAKTTGAKDAIRAAGAEVVTFNAHMGDRKVWPEDFQKVSFPKGTDVDAKLAEIAPYLPLLGDCGFDFEEQTITDAGLAHLANLPKMRDLNLTNTKVTGAGLAIFETSTGVARLQLFGTQVGNDGLAHIAHLSELKLLFLGRTRVTDAGIEHLTGLKKLEYVHFGEFVDVSPAGLAKLREALPGLEISE